MSEAAQPLLTFPCDFPIKAMGRDGEGFEATVLELVRRHAPTCGKTPWRFAPAATAVTCP